MKKTIALLCRVTLIFTLAVCFAGCDKVDEYETTNPAIEYTPIKLCMYLYDDDDEYLSNAQLKVTYSGEEFTYKTDYMGYIEVSDLSEGEEFEISILNEDGDVVAEETVVITYGESYSFDDKENDTEELIIPEGANPVSASFSITSDGKLNCISLS